jgi:hypothetical protein
MIPLDKNGREIKAGAVVIPCQTLEDYYSHPKALLVEDRHGVLYVGQFDHKPLSDFRNGDTAFHSVEIQ